MSYEEIISLDNLFAAWQEFILGKRKKRDVLEFSRNLIDNILQLHDDLANKTYKHGSYYQFNISDPKPRNISKASVRDRLLHHAVYRILYPFFDKIFVYDSYSCRLDKGTHKAIRRFRSMFLEVSDYNRKSCWILKCDIRKFFASIDHEILIQILNRYIPDQDVMWLLGEIIGSFASECIDPLEKGESLYYIRYADDFVLLSQNKQELIRLCRGFGGQVNQLTTIKEFLAIKLKLSLHPNKIVLKTFASGIDFLGWVNFPTHRTLRTTSKRRMMKRIIQHPTNETLQSYLGLLRHGNTFKLQKELKNFSWLFKES